MVLPSGPKVVTLGVVEVGITPPIGRAGMSSSGITISPPWIMYMPPVWLSPAVSPDGAPTMATPPLMATLSPNLSPPLRLGCCTWCICCH